MKYTIIPDIHADFERLNWSISQSKERQIVLLGDLIDGGKAVKLPTFFPPSRCLKLTDAGPSDCQSNMVS